MKLVACLLLLITLYVYAEVPAKDWYYAMCNSPWGYDSYKRYMLRLKFKILVNTAENEADLMRIFEYIFMEGIQLEGR